MESVREQIQARAPGIYSKDFIEVIFRYPTARSGSWNGRGWTRQTCAKYLRELERLGILHGQKIGRGVYFINRGLFELLTQ